MLTTSAGGSMTDQLEVFEHNVRMLAGKRVVLTPTASILPETLSWLAGRFDAHRRAVHAAAQARCEGLKLERRAVIAADMARFDPDAEADAAQCRVEAAAKFTLHDAHVEAANTILLSVAQRVAGFPTPECGRNVGNSETGTC